MNFSDFLRERRAQKNIASSKDHFEELGGKKSLGCELRQFQQIESGRYPPSEKILVALFNVTPASSRHRLLKSYFTSVLAGDMNASSLLGFLEDNLSPGIEQNEKSVWETSSRRSMIYTEAQLDYLIFNPDAAKLHKKCLWYDKWPRSKSGIPPSKLKALEELELVELRGTDIQPSRHLYRLPNFENSAPGPVSKATQYIQKQIDIYASKEGAANQELGYAAQLVTHDVARTIIDQTRALKKWIQANASTKTDNTVVPVVFVSFAKWLEPREV